MLIGEEKKNIQIQQLANFKYLGVEIAANRKKENYINTRIERKQ